ncbi:hypothetical protein LOTGIDRAFT_232799 [Lottia gigantea]|uniref:Chitin-binding type-2 domain-containing protein n=1 Tax=Lottia gigantea TaxID=225164 RepID=V4BVH7_LOTGI|nr:hypothetical protein LOTGIDRAFT_232799 [Lottia gigantea]ESO93029.1 hypothetical protein LOTGIDRAFT_232799 [Lottia gigantea]
MKSLLVVLLAALAVYQCSGMEMTLRTKKYAEHLPPTNYTELCELCGFTRTPHKYNCHLSVVCDWAGKEVHIQPCVDEKQMWGAGCSFCTNYRGAPYTTLCKFDELNNPCYGNDKRPVPDGLTCNGFHQCSANGNHIEHATCADGQKFDFEQRACVADIEGLCSGTVTAKPRRKQYNATCDEVPGDIHSQSITEFYEDTMEYRTTNVSCPASMVFDKSLIGTPFCCNEMDKVEYTECEPNNLVRASSRDEPSSWKQSLSGHLTPFSKIEGDAMIVNDPSNPFNGWAYFDGSTSFDAKKMSNNELRFFWNMTFDFQCGNMDASGRVNVGMQRNGVNGNPNPRVALIDNSACDIYATYGCHLILDSLSSGAVECFANNHTVSTQNLDLNIQYSVDFKRVGSEGIMEVKPANGAVIRRQFVFNDDEIIEGRDCDMTIGKGVGQRNFIGFIDNVMFYKNCEY